MLHFVTNPFGVPTYDSNHDRYQLEDENGQIFWLDGGVFAESVQDTLKAEPTWTYDQAKEFNFKPGTWAEDMDGVTPEDA